MLNFYLSNKKWIITADWIKNANLRKSINNCYISVCSIYSQTKIKKFSINVWYMRFCEKYIDKNFQACAKAFKNLIMRLLFWSQFFGKQWMNNITLETLFAGFLEHVEYSLLMNNSKKKEIANLNNWFEIYILNFKKKFQCRNH